MTDFSQLLDAAYQSERVASRRLARASGVSEEQALHATLLNKAGALGLAGLLAQRQAAAQALADQAQARNARRQAARHAVASRYATRLDTWRAWFDGSARPNPGRCGIGALLLGPRGESIEISLDAGYGSSSDAEYRALIALLEAALQAGAHDLVIHGDSRVVIDDMRAPASHASTLLAGHRRAAFALLGQLPGASLRWIPRQHNGAADALAQRASSAAAASGACGGPATGESIE